MPEYQSLIFNFGGVEIQFYQKHKRGKFKFGLASLM